MIVNNWRKKVDLKVQKWRIRKWIVQPVCVPVCQYELFDNKCWKKCSTQLQAFDAVTTPIITHDSKRVKVLRPQHHHHQLRRQRRHRQRGSTLGLSSYTRKKKRSWNGRVTIFIQTFKSSISFSFWIPWKYTK